MPFRRHARTSAILLLALAGPAAAQRAHFEQWSAAWSPGFHDDFEDGIPSSAYNVACGTATETDGRLVLTTATTGCPSPGFEVRPSVLSPGALVLRAIVSLPTVAIPGPTPGRIPPTTQGRAGLAVRNASGSDAVFLHIRRSNDVLQCVQDPCELDPTFGTGGNDVLYVELADETQRTISRSLALTVNPSPTEPTLAPAFELELTLAPDGVDLLPSARFRECALGYLSGGPCSTEPLEGLTPVAGPPETVSADGGVLAAADSHVPAFYATAPIGPFTVRIDDWDVAQGASDDFELAPLGSVAPYQTSTGVCGAASVADGALALDATDGCPKVIAAFAGSLASEASAAATLRWGLPKRCEQRGVALTAGPDQANLALVRDADGSLALWLTSEPEAGDGPAIPLLARSVLSATPESDPALADVVAIELRVSLADDGVLAPAGEYRLCETLPCEAGVAFTPLDPATFEPPATGSACGVDLAERAAPSDGGAFAAGVPVAANLSLVPEPGAVASALAAALALGALRRASAVR